MYQNDIFHTQVGGDKHFYLGGVQTFFVGGGFDDIDEEIDVSEANLFMSEASNLSAGARVLGARRALKFLLLT